jgi:hypothetical protein
MFSCKITYCVLRQKEIRFINFLKLSEISNRGDDKQRGTWYYGVRVLTGFLKFELGSNRRKSEFGPPTVANTIASSFPIFFFTGSGCLKLYDWAATIAHAVIEYEWENLCSKRIKRDHYIMIIMISICQIVGFEFAMGWPMPSSCNELIYSPPEWMRITGILPIAHFWRVNAFKSIISWNLTTTRHLTTSSLSFPHRSSAPFVWHSTFSNAWTIPDLDSCLSRLGHCIRHLSAFKEAASALSTGTKA